MIKKKLNFKWKGRSCRFLIQIMLKLIHVSEFFAVDINHDCNLAQILCEFCYAQRG